jgi:NADH-quinone oxidoreductase subunit G
VVKPRGEARPGWKVLRVLANLLGLQGFDFESSQDVLAHVRQGLEAAATHVPAERLNNAAPSDADFSVAAHGVAAPVVASIYQLDGLVRRATSLQLTADARGGQPAIGTQSTLDEVVA